MDVLVDHWRGEPKTWEFDFYVERIEFTDDLIRLIGEDSTLEILDNKESCCEDRYLVFDGHPGDLEQGGKLTTVQYAPTDELPDVNGSHEVAFIHILLSGYRWLTFRTHNVHNGYYGGFHLIIRKVPQGVLL